MSIMKNIDVVKSQVTTERSLLSIVKHSNVVKGFIFPTDFNDVTG